MSNLNKFLKGLEMSLDKYISVKDVEHLNICHHSLFNNLVNDPKNEFEYFYVAKTRCLSRDSLISYLKKHYVEGRK